jgi:hypothetical protein
MNGDAFAFVLFASLLLAVFALGYGLGGVNMHKSMQKQAIKHQCGEHNSLTGEFQWKDK